MALHRSVKVWTEHGMIPIGEIVNKRTKIRVWSYAFERDEFVLKRVVGWRRNQVEEKLGCARFANLARMSGKFPAFTTKTLWATPSHQIYTGDGAKQFLANVECLTTVEEQLSYTQEQLLYGSLLGDGHLRPDGLFASLHSTKQLAYLELKREILSAVTTQAIRTGKCSHGFDEALASVAGKTYEYATFATRAHPSFHRARNLCYVDKRRTISQVWLDKIDEMGLAFWFGDNGSARYQRQTTNYAHVTLSMEWCNLAEIETLQHWLRSRWSLDTYLEKSRKYAGRDCGWTLQLVGENAQRFFDLVAPYLPKALFYKLLNAPKTKRCKCGRKIALARKFCNKCLLKRFAADPVNNSRHTKKRFGSTAMIRGILASGNTPHEITGEERWQDRMAIAGSATKSMLKDSALTFRLVRVPFAYEENQGKRYEETKHAYDIQVEESQNYVANGILVSDSR